MKKAAILSALLVGTMAPAPVAAQVPPRVELPIRAVTLSDGVRRYAVTIQVDGQPVEVGLDTGSTGLRILPTALNADARARKGEQTRYHYGSGIQFTGAIIDAQLAMGGLSGKTRIARVDHIGCVERQRDCPAAEMDVATYRIQGDGLPGEGFAAIFGIGLKSDPTPNPLTALGVDRWIVELPRPSDSGPGRLILNPDDQEVARFKTFNLIGDGNLIPGCIIADGGTPRICAPAMLDTGANGLRVQGGKPADILPQGAKATLAIGDRAAVVSMPIEIGRRDQASGMRLYPAREGGGVSLSFGIAPYFRWSVLYSARDHRIGIADR